MSDSPLRRLLENTAAELGCGMRTTPQPPVLSAEALRTLARSNGNGELLARLRDGGWLDRQTFPPLQYAVPGVIPEGLTLLVAPPKAGKSWLVLGVALAAASGGRALGVLKVNRRPVLYLALEDGHRRVQERCRALLTDDPIPTGLHYLTTVEAGAVLTTIAAWLKLHLTTTPLVVLDTDTGTQQRRHRVVSDPDAMTSGNNTPTHPTPPTGRRSP